MSETQGPEPVIEHGAIDLSEAKSIRGSAAVTGATPSENFVAPTAFLDGPPPAPPKADD